MECNKEEARRAMEIAEKKISEKDYDGAKRFVNKAQSLYPTLDGLKEVLMIIDVYISATNRRGGEEEADWYKVLGVDYLADDEQVKKQYNNLALSLNPDTNKLNGAEGAFKLVLEAWCTLSDKVKRTSYDQKILSEMHEQPNPHWSASFGIQNSPSGPNPHKRASNNEDPKDIQYGVDERARARFSNEYRSYNEYRKAALNSTKLRKDDLIGELDD